MAKNTASDAAQTAFVRHGKLRRSNAWGNALRVLLTTMVVVALSGVATVAYAVWGLTQNLNTVDLGTEASGVGAGSQSVDGELTILLVGSDTRAGQEYDDGEEGELNDVNLLLHVSADHQNATVMSLPRDLMVPFPSCPGPNGEPDYYPPMSEQQLNSAMMYGGLPCVARTISNLTGMDIPYAALVTFDGVVGVSNALGGVDVCLTQPIVDEKADLDLPAGMNTLVGWDALQFLRTRHGVGDGGDTSRISNQQVFMSSLVRELKSAETLSDPVKVYALAKAGVENMTLSSNMASVEFMQAVAGTVKDIDLDRINFVQYPTVNHPYQEGRLTPDIANAELLIDVIKSGKPFAVTGVGEGVEAHGTQEAADPADGTEATTEAPATEDPAAQDPATEAPTTDTSGGATTAPEDTGPTKLPDSITGLQASNEACSAGRTVL
ncbi:LCP family protein [Leucobacter chromiireducens]|uniref:LCP family protein n=1 Tax=Leucobacter chromiireducens TaxID=283877 RepID=UPI000F62CFB4|nr:LCP family protein [Leucobacter chromiireducens]